MGPSPAPAPAARRPVRLPGAAFLSLLLLLPALVSCIGPVVPPLLLARSLMAMALRSGGCPPLASLDGSQTPLQLYRGVAACMRRSDTDTAVVLFSLAVAYGRYDALRVADPSAHQAGMLLRLVALQRLDEAQRQALSRGMSVAQSEAGRRQNLCAAIERIGAPTYRPDYMSRHGAMALRRSFSEQRPPASRASPERVQDFDGEAAWNQVLDRVLRCSST
jgi:hypothetical protein